jgi:hypothetical protein
MVRMRSAAWVGVVFCTAVVTASGQTPATQSGTAKPAAARPAAPVALPPAIDVAFKKAFPTATIRNVSKEKENGREQYEVESTDQGKGRDLIYLADGTLVEMEEELSAAELPTAAAAAITARYPTATITKRERLTITKGHVVQYEVALSGVKVKEVVLTADGKWISPKS